MRKEDERALCILVGLYVLSKYSWEIAPALQNFGASVYDALHDDGGHKNDLPGKQLTRQAVLALATQAGFPDPKMAAAIAYAESAGIVNALARTAREYSVGLWQVNTKVHPYTPAQMADPRQNAAAAFKISKGGRDWTPWATFTNGKYLEQRRGVLA